MEVVVESAAGADRAKPGQSALVYVAESPNEALPGVVRAVEGGTVIVEFASSSALVRPGLSAGVAIQLR